MQGRLVDVLRVKSKSAVPEHDRAALVRSVAEGEPSVLFLTEGFRLACKRASLGDGKRIMHVAVSF